MNRESEFWPVTRPTLLRRMEDAEDHAAWWTFQQRYQTAVLRIARGAGLSDPEANEVLARTIEAVWKSLGTYDPGRGAKFRSWLAGIVHHRIHEQVRRRPRHEPLPAEGPTSSAWSPLPSGAVTEPDVLRRLEAADEAALDQEAWTQLKNCLPPKHWQVLHELLVHERTGEAVAARLGLSRTNVYVIRLRAGAKLKEIRARLASAEEQTP